jgi:formiminotetrahydrofolate cyclodeaminase
MPKSREEEVALRSQALENAYKAAARVPLATASACLGALELCVKAVELGKRSALSDGAVGAAIAAAAIEGALLNVRINLSSIADQDFRESCLAEIARIGEKASELKTAVDGTISARLPS